MVLGWTGRDVNMMWYAPYYAYTAATYLSVIDGDVPPVAAIIYTLLASLLTLDALRDLLGGTNGRQRRINC